MDLPKDLVQILKMSPGWIGLKTKPNQDSDVLNEMLLLFENREAVGTLCLPPRSFNTQNEPRLNRVDKQTLITIENFVFFSLQLWKQSVGEQWTSLSSPNSENESRLNGVNKQNLINIENLWTQKQLGFKAVSFGDTMNLPPVVPILKTSPGSHSRFGPYFCSNLYGYAPRGPRGVKRYARIH